MPRNQFVESRRIKPSHSIARYLEREFPIQLVATLSIAHRSSQVALDTLFAEWIAAIQKRERITIAWVRADEIRRRRHSHILLIAAKQLSVEQAILKWELLAGSRFQKAAHIEPFHLGQGGAAYVLKTWADSDGDVRFSPNIGLFAKRPGRKMNSAERRQCRRIARHSLAHPFYKNKKHLSTGIG